MKCYDPNALAASVQKARSDRLRVDVLHRVYACIPKVLVLIYEDDGNNDLVEQKRGKLFIDPIAIPDEDSHDKQE